MLRDPPSRRSPLLTGSPSPAQDPRQTVSYPPAPHPASPPSTPPPESPASSDTPRHFPPASGLSSISLHPASTSHPPSPARETACRSKHDPQTPSTALPAPAPLAIAPAAENPTSAPRK